MTPDQIKAALANRTQEEIKAVADFAKGKDLSDRLPDFQETERRARADEDKARMEIEFLNGNGKLGTSDPVHKPTHYRLPGLDVEVIDVVEAVFGTQAHLVQAVQYLLRAGRKTQDPTEDVRKAVFYLNRWLKKNASPATGK
jgi:hypothetical protein